MEKLKARLKTFAQALSTLDSIINSAESLLAPPPEAHGADIIRDATIQRFEYTFEAGWKALQAFLADQEGLVCNSPKSCLRGALSAGLLNAAETELALRMVDDRNQTTHTYLEAVACAIAAAIPGYTILLRRLLTAMTDRLR